MSRLDDIFSGPVKEALASTTVSSHGFGATGGAGVATVRTTSAIISQIGGVTRTRAALAGQSLAPTHDIFGQANTSRYTQPINTTVYYTLGVDASGNIAVVQGTFAGQNLVPPATAGLGAIAQAGTSFVGDGSIPNLPETFDPVTGNRTGFAPFGLMKVQTNASATFIPGTTGLDAAGITFTFWDINLIPEVKL